MKLSVRGLISLLFLLVLSFAGCDVINPQESTPMPIPTLVGSSDIPIRGSGVVASGEVVPAQVAELSFDRAGRILSVSVAEDEIVEMGQILAQLEGQESLEAAVIAAEMSLLSAQQELDQLSDNLSLTEADVFQTIVEINREIGDIQYRLYNLNIPSSYAGMEIVEALNLAKERLDQARLDYEPYKFKSSGDATRRNLGEKVEQTRSDFNSILRRLENEAALKDAEARLEKAETDYQAAQVGPDSDAVAMAEASLKNAEAQLEVAQKALEGINLVAPISGSAVSVDIFPGDAVLPGQGVVTLADLNSLRVETTDLSERDVAEVEIGQTATVYVEALDQELPGRVVRIAPQAVIVGGDVTYTVVVELEELPAGLRWGMTVEVDITPD